MIFRVDLLIDNELKIGYSGNENYNNLYLFTRNKSFKYELNKYKNNDMILFLVSSPILFTLYFVNT